MEEKRSCFRWQIDHPAKLKLEGAESFASCIINNINMKGMKLSLRMRLPLDTFLRFTLVLKEEFVLDIEGWLVWHKTLMDTNIYGLYFTKLKDLDKEKIYKFVQAFYPEQIKRQYCQGLEKEDKTIKEDRRIFERIPVQIPLRFLELYSNKEGTALTYNISAKGIGLLTQEELLPHASLELWLDIPGQTEPFYTRADVVWSKRINPDTYKVGLNLERADLMGLSRALRMPRR